MPLAQDTETRGLSWFDQDERAFLATYSDRAADHLVRGAERTDALALAEMKGRMANTDALLFHNAKFDIHQTRETWGFDVLDLDVPIHDTDLLSRVLFPEGQRKGSRGGHGLKNLGKIHLGEDADAEERAIEEAAKSIGLRTLRAPQAYYRVWQAYPDLMEAYALKDTRMTYDIWVKFMARLGDSDPRLTDVYNLELAVLPILTRAEERGVAVDQERVTALRAEYSAAAERLHEELVKNLGSYAIDGEQDEVWEDDDDYTTKTEALREALLKQGVPLYRRTKKSNVLSTNKFALQEFEGQFPIVRALLDYRRYQKFLATYLDHLFGRDVVHCDFRQANAWTGRMSCARPNMQNIPRGAEGVRSAFIARPGCSFVVLDYDSIEMRAFAYYLGSDEFRRRVHEEDPHAWIASVVHGGDPGEYAKGGPGAPVREKLKNTQYAILYGAGAPRVSDMNQSSKQEAKALISKVKRAWPGYYDLKDRVDRKIKAEGHVNTVLGRRQVVSRDKSYVGLNALIQGSAADIMKLGIIKADRALADAGLDARMVLFVHDEVVVECPDECAQEVQRVVTGALESAWPLDPPLVVSGGIAKSYGAAK